MFGQRRKILADISSSPALHLFDNDFATNHLRIQGIPWPMWRQMNVKMGHATAKHVDVNQLRARLLAKHSTHARQDFSERARFLAVEVCNMWNVPLGFEIGEAEDFGVQADRESPEGIFPHLDTVKLRIARSAATNDALRLSFDVRHSATLSRNQKINHG